MKDTEEEIKNIHSACKHIFAAIHYLQQNMRGKQDGDISFDFYDKKIKELDKIRVLILRITK